MRCSVLAAQWCWYCHKHDTPGGIQSVDNQVGQEEGPAEEISRFIKVGEAMS